MKIKDNLLCMYCGASAECREHVVPVSYLSFARSYNEKLVWLVPACNNCNSLAGPFIAFSIPEKAKYVMSRFKLKYKKILNYPEWTEEEMKSIDYGLKEMVWAGIVAKRVAKERLSVLEKTCNLPVDYQRPTFIEEQIREATKVLNVKTKKKRKKKICKKT